MGAYFTVEKVFDDEVIAVFWCLYNRLSPGAKWALKRRWESDNGYPISNANYRTLFGYRPAK